MAYIFHKLRAAIADFQREENGASMQEAVIMFPLIIMAFTAVYSFTDAYRVKSNTLKANYAVSDLLSRTGNIIDMNDLYGMESLFRYMTRTADTDTWLRVTVVFCEEKCDQSDRELGLDWSRSTKPGVAPPYTEGQIRSALGEAIPVMAEGERLIIVETLKDWTPSFGKNLTGFGGREFIDTVMTRPRFSKQLCFQGVGCGA